MADQAKATEKAEYTRTLVKAKNPKPGLYRTVDGNWEIERVDGSKKWSIFQVATDESGKPTGERDLARKDAGTYDEALNVVRELSPRSLEELNTAPAKPKAAKPADPPKAEESPAQPPKLRESVKAPKTTARPRVTRRGSKVA
jgi:hypothetical protein